MKAQRLLLVPFLSPLLAVLLVAAFNPGPPLSVRLLTWVSPRAPLGLWLASAALGGAALSGAGTALALREGVGRQGRRRPGQGRSRAAENWSREGDWREGDWREGVVDRDPGGRWGGEPDILAAETPWGSPSDSHQRAPRASGPPPRAPGDPAPTVAVPFRILRRGEGAGEGHREPFAPEPAVATDRPQSVPVGAGDDWDAESGNEDW
ncbi:MAG: hypothetical protein ACK59A_10100 [Cyanobacteriota bacterium]|jgi:hypothetical protein